MSNGFFSINDVAPLDAMPQAYWRHACQSIGGKDYYYYVPVGHKCSRCGASDAEPTPAAAAKSGTPTGTEALVCADIARRQQLGIAKYGQTVADNPLALRAWLQHAYEEVLDQAVYLRRAIQEIDANEQRR